MTPLPKEHKIIFALLALVALISFGYATVHAVLAFNGPSSSSGSGSGAIGVDSANDVGIGTSTTSLLGAKLLVVASSTGDASNYAFKVVDSSGNPLIIVRNDGSTALGTATQNGPGSVTVSNLFVTGNFGATVNANNVSAGEFSPTGGNFSFPSKLGIGTNSPGYALDVQDGQINASGGLCIGGHCITSFPSNGNVGTVTGVTAGTGLTGGTITSTGTIALNFANADTWTATQTFNGSICLGGVCNLSWPTPATSSQWTTSAAGIYYNGGNVGIGTTTPSFPLDLGGSSNATGTINIPFCTNLNSNGWILSGGKQNIICDTSTGHVELNAPATAGGSLDFTTGGVADANILMTVLNNGNVGIGTSAPVNTLQVVGNGLLLGSGQFGTNNGFRISQDATGNLDVNYMSGGSVYSSPMTLGWNGVVGIGTATPAYPLDVNGIARASNVIDTGAASQPCLGTSAAGQLQAGTCGTSQWTTAGTNIYYNGGNVGIDTASPAYTLDVNGSINTNAGYYTSGPIYRTAAGAGYLNGRYTQAETSGTSGAIYSIGGGYVPGATNLGNMYGIGYGYSGSAGITLAGLPAGNWGMYVASAGTLRIFLDSDSGNIYAAGTVNDVGETVNGTLQASTVIDTGIASQNCLGTSATGQLQAGTCGGGVSGGTANYVPLWTGASSIGLSAISQSGATVSVGTASGETLVIGGGTGKITAGTFDPAYSIGGQGYATYLPGMTGEKEETAGSVELAPSPAGGYQATLNFATAAQGSDLWLWRSVIDASEDFQYVSVMLTPGFDGNAWYTKDATDNQIVIHGASAGEVSYQLIGRRFDWQKWANAQGDGTDDGIVVPAGSE